MSGKFVMLQRAYPEGDMGPEYGIFDRTGVIAASYRKVLGACHVWVYKEYDSSIARHLILKGEDLAQLYCEEVAKDRGAPMRIDEDPPDLDSMLKDLNR